MPEEHKADIMRGSVPPTPVPLTMPVERCRIPAMAIISASLHLLTSALLTGCLIYWNVFFFITPHASIFLASIVLHTGIACGILLRKRWSIALGIWVRRGVTIVQCILMLGIHIATIMTTPQPPTGWEGIYSSLTFMIYGPVIAIYFLLTWPAVALFKHLTMREYFRE